MRKKAKYTFGGANQDIAKDKHPFQYYFDAQHIRIIATDTQGTGDVMNEKGTELVISLPAVTIIGQTLIPVVANVDNVNLATDFGVIEVNVLSNDVYVEDVTITITQQPLKGTVTVLANNRIQYTNTIAIPLGETDTFTYQIDDGTTTDTAVVTVTSTVQETVVNEGGGDNVEDTSNYDGTFWYYTFAPCDRTKAFFVGKSMTKIDDNRIVTFFGSGGVGLLGSVAYKASVQHTVYTTNGLQDPFYGTNCPPQDELPGVEY